MRLRFSSLPGLLTIPNSQLHSNEPAKVNSRTAIGSVWHDKLKLRDPRYTMCWSLVCIETQVFYRSIRAKQNQEESQTYFFLKCQFQICNRVCHKQVSQAITTKTLYLAKWTSLMSLARTEI